VEGIAGALLHILHCEVIAGRGHKLPVLSEYLSYVTLTPFLGPDAAAQAVVRARTAGAQSGKTPTPGGAAANNGATSGHRAAKGKRAIADHRGATSHDATTTNHKATASAKTKTKIATTRKAAASAKTATGQETVASNGATTTNGSAPGGEDYRRLADRRSAKCVNTTPTSTESTITTIKGT
jgi:hypothetical protein